MYMLMLLVAHICHDFKMDTKYCLYIHFFFKTSSCVTPLSLGTCVLGVFFVGAVIVCMCAPVCLIFVLGGPVFIVGPTSHCLRELRLQALFQAEQECPPHYSGPG